MKNGRILGVCSVAALIFGASTAWAATTQYKRDLSMTGLNFPEPCKGYNLYAFGNAHTVEQVTGNSVEFNMNFNDVTARDIRTGHVYKATTNVSEKGTTPSTVTYVEKIKFQGTKGETGFTLPLKLLMQYDASGAQIQQESIAPGTCDKQS